MSTPLAPWSIRNVPIEVRDRAKASAKEKGVTLGAWLVEGIRAYEEQERAQLASMSGIAADDSLQASFNTLAHELEALAKVHMRLEEKS